MVVQIRASKKSKEGRVRSAMRALVMSILFFAVHLFVSHYILLKSIASGHLNSVYSEVWEMLSFPIARYHDNIFGGTGLDSLVSISLVANSVFWSGCIFMLLIRFSR